MNWHNVILGQRIYSCMQKTKHYCFYGVVVTTRNIDVHAFGCDHALLLIHAYVIHLRYCVKSPNYFLIVV